MKITKSRYKNVSAYLLETQKYKVTVLDRDGGKIVSFIDADGNEYLAQNPSERYQRIREYDDYVKGECSGFDDMFPTIDPITIREGERAGLIYPDHGAVSRAQFKVEIKDGKLILTKYFRRLKFRYTKTFCEDADGKIAVGYQIENRGDEFKALWAAHCMLKAVEGGKLILPVNIGDGADMTFDTLKPFKGIKEVKITDNLLRSADSFSDTEDSYKYYLTERIREGKIGYGKERIFFMEYDADKLPYLGIWINDGAFKNLPCVALEPCNVGYDTVYEGEKRGQSFSLKRGQSWSFNLKLYISNSK